MKEAKIQQIDENLFEVKTPAWCWDSRPYLVEGLKQLIARGKTISYVYRKWGFIDVYRVLTQS